MLILNIKRSIISRKIKIYGKFELSSTGENGDSTGDQTKLNFFKHNPNLETLNNTKMYLIVCIFSFLKSLFICTFGKNDKPLVDKNH